MPSKTAKQHRAMAAAAHGKSNIGIPKGVGEEFLHADKRKKKKGGKQFDLPPSKAGRSKR